MNFIHFKAILKTIFLFVYLNKLIKISESKKDSIVSIWFITVSIFNQKQEAVFKKTLLMNLVPQATMGIGFPMDLPSSTPNAIMQALQKGTSLFKIGRAHV